MGEFTFNLCDVTIECALTFLLQRAYSLKLSDLQWNEWILHDDS